MLGLDVLGEGVGTGEFLGTQLAGIGSLARVPPKMSGYGKAIGQRLLVPETALPLADIAGLLFAHMGLIQVLPERLGRGKAFTAVAPGALSHDGSIVLVYRLYFGRAQLRGLLKKGATTLERRHLSGVRGSRGIALACGGGLRRGVWEQL